MRLPFGLTWPLKGSAPVTPAPPTDREQAFERTFKKAFPNAIVLKERLPKRQRKKFRKMLCQLYLDKTSNPN